MSLFRSIFGDLEQDPIFGAHTRMMNRMMNPFFGDEFGTPRDNPLSIMGPQMGMGMGMGRSMMPFGGHDIMNPFGAFPGIPDINSMMANANNGDARAFSSMSVTSISTGPDGQPQVYQASNSTVQGPGGVKEIRKTVADSRSGRKKMAIGRHLGDRAHVIEKEMNLRTGQREESEDFVNLDEGEVSRFDREWKERFGRGFSTSGCSNSTSLPAIASSRHANYPNSSHQYVPTASASAAPIPSGTVTIEELPPSDDEEEMKETVSHTSSRHAPSPSSRASYSRRVHPKEKHSKKRHRMH